MKRGDGNTWTITADMRIDKMNMEKIIDDCIFLMLWDTQVDDSGYNNLGMYCDRKSFDPESLKLVTDHILDYIDKNKNTLSKIDEEEIPLHYVMSHNDIFLAAYPDFSKVFAYYR